MQWLKSWLLHITLKCWMLPRYVASLLTVKTTHSQKRKPTQPKNPSKRTTIGNSSNINPDVTCGQLKCWQSLLKRLENAVRWISFHGEFSVGCWTWEKGIPGCLSVFNWTSVLCVWWQLFPFVRMHSGVVFGVWCECIMNACPPYWEVMFFFVLRPGSVIVTKKGAHTWLKDK